MCDIILVYGLPGRLLAQYGPVRPPFAAANGLLPAILKYYSYYSRPKRAGFPFTVSYTVAGEPATFEGTLVCQFGSYQEKADGTGKYRTWGESYGGGRTGQTIYRREGIKEYYDGIQWAPCAALSQGLDEEDRYDLRIKICFGNPGYYMGDGEKDPQYPCIEVGVYWVPEEYTEFNLVETTIYGDEIYDSPILAAYGIQITGVEIADPIENSFSEPDEGKT